MACGLRSKSIQYGFVPHLEPVQIGPGSDHDHSSNTAWNTEFCAGFLHAVLEIAGHVPGEFPERPDAQTPGEELRGQVGMTELQDCSQPNQSQPERRTTARLECRFAIRLEFCAAVLDAL
jgi:hypothetical protein